MIEWVRTSSTEDELELTHRNGNSLTFITSVMFPLLSQLLTLSTLQTRVNSMTLTRAKSRICLTKTPSRLPVRTEILLKENLKQLTTNLWVFALPKSY